MPAELGEAYIREEYATEEAWLAARRSCLGASEAYLALAKPAVLYARRKGLLADPEETDALKAGRYYQAADLAWYAAETGRTVTPHVHVLLRSVRWPWLGCSLDAEQRAEGRAGPGTLESKHFGAYALRDFEGDEGSPLRLRVRCQVQQQLAVTGWAWGTLWAVFGGARPRWQDEAPFAEFQARLVEATRELWRRLELSDPPRPEGGDEETRGALRALYPRDEGSEIVLSERGADAATAWVEADEEAKRWATLKDAAAATIQAEMGPAARATCLAGAWTWRTQTRHEPAREARDSTFRVFRRGR